MSPLPHLGLCVGLALSPVATGWVATWSERVTLPVVERSASGTKSVSGACTVETVHAESGVTVRVRTSTPRGPELEHDQDFAIPAADLPLRPGWAIGHEGMGLADALTYDGTDVRFELRATEKPRRAIVYELTVDPALRAVRGVRITEYDDPAPGAPVRATLSCEPLLN